MYHRPLPVVLTAILVTHFSSLVPMAFGANPESTNYKIHDYSFGSGGTSNSTSANYGLHGIAGQVEFGSPESTTYKIGSGLTFIMKALVPPAPDCTNPDTAYNRVHCVVQTGAYPTDTTYALQISTDVTFATNIYYVKSDNTIGDTLTETDFKSISNWGGSTGIDITGLQPDTTYYLRTKARQGDFTESEYGPSDSTATQLPSLTFSVDNDTVTFDNLNADNTYTDTTKSTTITTSTNASNGYIVNARSTGEMSGGGATIPNYSSANASPTSWTGNGFGYTTSDTNLTGGAPGRFTDGGPKYAGFTTDIQGDPVADHTGPVTSPIVEEPFTINYRIQTSNTQKAAKYTTTILYIVVPSY